MRLERLKIQKYKLLQNFEISFDSSNEPTVLLGDNATGKSYLIEALVKIFASLDLTRNEPPFAYELSYRWKDHLVQIDADPVRKTRRVIVQVDNKNFPLGELGSSEDRRFVPRHVFAYYSGSGRRLEECFESHREKFYQEMIRSPKAELRPFFYSRLVHSQFVLLAFFANATEKERKFLSEYLRIEDLDSVLFILRQPPWSGLPEGDHKFWMAAGVVKTFLNELFNVSLAPMYWPAQASSSTRTKRSSQKLYLFVPDKHAFQKLVDRFRTGQQLFANMESTFISDLLEEVRIRVKVRGVDGAVSFRDLSEGEKQLLTVLGLLKFTEQDESLILLDEPDTHINPNWAYWYLQILKDTASSNPSSHLLLTTHNPLTFASMLKEDVRVLDRSEDSETPITANEPPEDPQGMGITGIATRIFGVPSPVDPVTQELLNERLKLLAKGGTKTKSDLERIREITTALDKLGFSRMFSDPLYTRFVEAIARRPEYQKPVVTPEELEAQDRVADQIIDDLLKQAK